MSVKFALLPREELLLLDAVEAMSGQYGGHSLARKADSLLALYGLGVDAPDYEESSKFSELMDVSRSHKEQIGYGTTAPNFSPDRLSLSPRSVRLLVTLAGVSSVIVRDHWQGGKFLDHQYMSAGETACFQLRAYALLVDSPIGEYYSEEGLALVEIFLSDTFDPTAGISFGCER